jgi:hypothetical protein
LPRRCRGPFAHPFGSSSPIEAMLDTGSTGLRILPGALSPANYVIMSRANEYGYGSGVKLTGRIANASVDIGGAVTDEPIPIQIIQTVGCFENKPRCPASRVAQTAYGLGGDGLPNEGFRPSLGSICRFMAQTTMSSNRCCILGSEFGSSSYRYPANPRRES